MTTAAKPDPSLCSECGWEYTVCDCGMDDDGELDEHEEAMYNCHGFFENPDDPNSVFVCGAVGSEDCDCCQFYGWLGKTNAEIDAEELP